MRMFKSSRLPKPCGATATTPGCHQSSPIPLRQATFGVILGLLLAWPLSTRALTNNLALTPPMGWNSWNHYACNISDPIIRGIANAMATNGMKAAGYQFINIDDCWQVTRDTNGVIVPDPTRFPYGIKALADYVHSKGLKLGVYSDHGLETCQGRPGGFGYEYLDANTYAAWGVDYLKYDNCNLPAGDVSQTDYARMADALMKSGRPITFSICHWSFESWEPAAGNLWRTTGDISDSFASMVSNLGGNSPPAYLAGPGRWNDPDMLEVGNGGMTFTEDQAHFSLWCLVSAPLIAGNDLSAMSSQTFSILTNAELIAVDQDPAGEQGVALPNTGTNQIWVKPLGTDFTTKAVGLFNPNTNPATITVNWTNIGLLAGSATVRDLWARTNLGTINNSFSTNVPAHGAVVLKVTGTPPVLPGPGTNYLSALQQVYGYVGWGSLGINKSIGGNTLTLNGKTYTKGLGAHAFSGLEYRLGGIASRFQSDIGVDDESGANGSVVFHVLADGAEIFTSGVMTGGAAHQAINLDVTGVNRLTLGVSDADDGINSDHADWAGALVVVSNTVAAPPPVPTGLSASSGQPISLNWNATRSAAVYNIKRAPAAGGTYTNLSSTVLPTYADTNVVSGNTYYYKVSGVSSFGESSNSAPASALACAPPLAPLGVIAVPSAQTVIVSWNPVAGASGYSVARALSSTPFSIIATGLTATNYTDRNVSSGTNYSYVVFANNSCAQSSQSAYANATPILPVGSIALQRSGGNVLLTWPQGTLLSATNLTGPWVTNPAASPNTVSATNAQMFFRLQLQANPISINFSGSGSAMAASESAGVIAETNWNNAPNAFSVGLALNDATGKPSGATVAWSANGAYATGISDTAGNYRMMKNYLDTGNTTTTTVTVSGLLAHANGWDVYVCFDGSNTETREGNYTLSGAGIATTSIIGYDTANVDFSGSFIQASNSAGNYLRFSIPNVSGFTLTATPINDNDTYPRAPVNGMQIIPK
jgi:alpha-galactosidase